MTSEQFELGTVAKLYNIDHATNEDEREVFSLAHTLFLNQDRELGRQLTNSPGTRTDLSRCCLGQFACHSLQADILSKATTLTPADFQLLEHLRHAAVTFKAGASEMFNCFDELPSEDLRLIFSDCYELRQPQPTT